MSLYKWPRKIVLVRHPEAIHNVKFGDDRSEKGQANHSYSLTDTGEQQAQIVRPVIQNYAPYDVRFVSTFLRTQNAMPIYFPAEEFVVDSRLDEWWRGVHHLYSKDEVRNVYPLEQVALDREGVYHHRSIHGENGPDVEGRVYSFISDLRLFYSNKTVFISAHGNWMLFFWRIIENRSIDEWYEMYQNNKPKNTALWVYEPLSGINGLTRVFEK